MFNETESKKPEATSNGSAKPSSARSNVTEHPGYRVIHELADIKYTLLTTPIVNSGHPIIGRGLAAIPTLAFGIHEHIEKGSSFGKAFTDIGVDVAVARYLPLPAQVALKLSEFAAYGHKQTPEYMALFSRDSDHEIERWDERGMLAAASSLYYTVQGIKSGIGAGIEAAHIEQRRQNEISGQYLANYEHCDNFGERLHERHMVSFLSELGAGAASGTKQFFRTLKEGVFNSIPSADIPPAPATTSTNKNFNRVSQDNFSLGTIPYFYASSGSQTLSNGSRLLPNPYLDFGVQDPAVFPIASLSSSPQAPLLPMDQPVKGDASYLSFSNFNLPQSSYSQPQEFRFNPNMYFTPHPITQLPIHGEFEWSSAKGFRIEIAMPIIGAGAKFGPIGIAVAVVAIAGLMLYGKSVKEKYKKLGEEFDKIDRRFQASMNKVEALQADIKRFEKTGKIEDVNIIISKIPDIIGSEKIKGDTLQYTAAKANKHQGKIKSKYKSVDEKDKKLAENNFQNYINECRALIKNLEEVKIYFEAYCHLVENHPKSCLEKLNKIPSVNHSGVASLKFNAYLQLGDDNSAKQYLPLLSPDLQSESAQHLAELTVQKSLAQVKDIVTNILVTAEDTHETLLSNAQTVKAEKTLTEIDALLAKKLSDVQKIDFYNERIKLLNRLGRGQEEIIQEYKKIQKVEENNKSAIIGLANIYVQQKKWDLAAQEVEKIVDKHPELDEYLTGLNINATQQKIDLYLLEKNHTYALAMLENLSKLITSDLDRVSYHLQKAKIFSEMSDYHAANDATMMLENSSDIASLEKQVIGEYKQVQIISADNVIAAIELAKIYAKNNDLTSAALEVEKVSNQDPTYAEYYVSLKINATHQKVNQLLASNKHAAALTTLDGISELMTAQSNQLFYRLQKAKIYTLMSEYASFEAKIAEATDANLFVYKMQEAKTAEMQAVKEYQQAQEIFPDNSDAAMGLMAIHIKNHDLPSAIAEIKKISEQNSMYDDYLKVLQNHHNADELVKSGKRLIEQRKENNAVQKFQEAQELSSDHFEATLALAEVHASNARFDDAIKEIKKLTGQEAYIADLQVMKVLGNVSPFVRTLTSIASLHLQQGGLHPVVSGGLKVFIACHHIHPQSLTAALPLMAAHFQQDVHALTAWSRSLSKHFEPVYTAKSALQALWRGDLTASHYAFGQVVSNPTSVFLVNGLLSSLQALSLDGYIPYHREMSEVVGYSQSGIMCYQAAQDLRLLNAVRAVSWAELNIAAAIKSSSLAFAIPLILTNPALAAYDKFMHNELAPETVKECVRRDMVPIGINMASSLLMPEVLIPYNLAAHVIIPAWKWWWNIYNEEANAGRLRNARYLITHTESEKQLQGRQRYDHLNNYRDEMNFVDATTALQPIAHFNFSPIGEKHKIDSSFAVHLISKAISSKDFDQQPMNIQNNYIQAQKSLVHASGDVRNEVTVAAHELYVRQLSQLGFAVSSEEYADKAHEHVEEAYTKFLKERSLLQRASDWFISMGALNLLSEEPVQGAWLPARPKVSSAELNTKRQSIKEQKRQIHENAVQFSAGKSQHSFGIYLLELLSTRSEQESAIEELNYELTMIKILGYLYGERVQRIETKENLSFKDEKVEDKLDINKIVELLLIIQAHSRNSKLKYLASFLQREITGQASSESNVLLINARATRANQTLHQDPRLIDMLAEASRIQHLENVSQNDKNFTDFLQCFLDLASNKPVNNKILSVVISEYMEKSPDNETEQQFRYRTNSHVLADKSLVELYLSAMISFMYLVTALTTDTSPHKKIIEFQYEILSNILLRGYLPPFGLMMVRVTGRYKITEDQARALLSWYGLDLNKRSAREKLKILVALCKSPHISRRQDIATLGELCQTWGNLVRKTLFIQAGEKTLSLYRQLRNMRAEDNAIKLLKTQLMEGADPNYHKKNRTLLHLVVEKQWPTAVEVLCQYGHYIDCENQCGLTPIQLAAILFAKKESPQLITIEGVLRKYGAKLTQAANISWWQAPIWWWYYSGKTTQVLLQPQIDSNKLSTAALTVLSSDTSAFPDIQAIANPDAPKEEVITKNKRSLMDTIASLKTAYTVTQVYALIQFYAKNHTGHALQVQFIENIITYFDDIKKYSNKKKTNIIFTQCKNYWMVLYFFLDNSKCHLIVSSQELPFPEVFFKKIFEDNIEIYKPDYFVEVVDSGPLIIEAFRLLLEDPTVFKFPSIPLLQIRWDVQLPILKGQHNPINKITVSGLTLKKIKGDGNCLYSAIAGQIDQDQQDLRNQVATYLEQHRVRFKPFIVLRENQTFEQYVQGIRNSEWGDDLEIHILMQILNRPILVIDPHKRISHQDTVDLYAGDIIFVFYNGHNHYDAFIKDNAITGRQVFSKLLQDNEGSPQFEFKHNEPSLNIYHAAAFHQADEIDIFIQSGVDIHQPLENNSILQLVILNIKKEQWQVSEKYRARIADCIRILCLNGVSIQDITEDWLRTLNLDENICVAILNTLKIYSEDRQHKRVKLLELAKNSSLSQQDKDFIKNGCYITRLCLPLDEDMHNIVFQAIVNSNLDLLSYLFDLYPNFSEMKLFKKEQTILHIAVHYLNLRVITFILLRFSKLLSKKNVDDETPLHSLVRILASTNLESNFSEIEQITALFIWHPDANFSMKNKLEQTVMQLAKSFKLSSLGSFISQIEEIDKNSNCLINAAYNSIVSNAEIEHLFEGGIVQVARREEETQCMAIHIAAWVGNKVMLARILQHDPRMLIAQANEGRIPLHYACRNNQLIIVDYLLYIAKSLDNNGLYEAILLMTDDHQFFALDHAWQGEHVELYRYLLFHYSKILNEKELKQRLVQHFLESIKQKMTEMVNVLLEMVGLKFVEDFEVFVQQYVLTLSENDKQALWISLLNAEEKGIVSTEQIKSLHNYFSFISIIEHNEDISPQNKSELRALLKQPKYAYKKNVHGKTRAHQFAERGNTEFIHATLLHDYQLLVMTDMNGWLLLHYAAAYHQAEALKFLLMQAAHLSNARTAENNDLNTPILLAIIHFNYDNIRGIKDEKLEILRTILKILIMFGANPNLPNARGQTAVSLLEDKKLPNNLILGFFSAHLIETADIPKVEIYSSNYT